MKVYEYVCVVVDCSKTHLAYNIRKTPFLCYDCKLQRNAIRNEIQRKTAILKKQLVRERGSYCQRCQATGTELVAHHIVAVADGGATEPSNIEILCSACHKKHYEKVGYGQWTAYRLLPVCPQKLARTERPVERWV